MDQFGKTIKKGDQIELMVEGLNHLGQGIGRFAGQAIFIPGGLPGDRVRIVIEKTHTRYAVGKRVKQLSASADRIIPACPLADRCGGCTLQPLAYQAQLSLKSQLVVDALRRIGNLAVPDLMIRPIIGMDDPWHYRTKVQFPVAGGSDDPKIGFFAAASHTVVPGEVCPIQPAVCDRIRAAVLRHIQRFAIAPYDETAHQGLLRHLIIRMGMYTGDIMVILVINGEALPGWSELYENLQIEIAAATGEPGPGTRPYRLASFYLNVNKAKTNLVQSNDLRLLAGDPWIEEEILGLIYRISPLVFFQVNPIQTARLFTTALDFANPTNKETIVDLYCGTGSITLQLARRAGRAVGIEINEAAINDARVNAEQNGIRNVEFSVGAAEKLLPELVHAGLAADCVVLDPPRKGCDPALIDTLIRCKPGRIVYVSCNPATLARDIALLTPAGYKVTDVQPVDMFPWTTHVETVVLMCREGR